MNYYQSGSVISDFRKRAKNYEKKSRFTTDEDILNIPLKYLLSKKTAGNLLDAGRKRKRPVIILAKKMIKFEEYIKLEEI